jgi:hypothetical protein
VNCWRPSGASWYAPLHQAAHGDALIEIIRRLVDLGAWRTLRTKEGERPIDIARRKGHVHLSQILEPVYKRQVPIDTLQKSKYNSTKSFMADLPN